MRKERLFKVRYGYDHTQYAVVKEGNELEKAIYAWTEQLPVQVGGKMFSGKSIIAIEPHYHAYTGWNEFYKPTDGNDWKQIERDCPNFDGAVENAKNFVTVMLKSGTPEKIGSGESLLQIQSGESVENSSITADLVEKFKIN